MSRQYLFALSAIALSIIVSQVLIHSHLNDQKGDSRVINVAGRQRMLSQKLSKEILLVNNMLSKQLPIDTAIAQLGRTLDLWRRSHEGLLHGDSMLGLPGKNSPQIRRMFAEIEPFYAPMLRHTQAIIQLAAGGLGQLDHDPFQASIDTVLQNEGPFLAQMDKIVFRYDEEADAKVNALRRTEWILLLVGLLILVLEIIFIFRPAAEYVRQTIARMRKGEEEARQMTQEVEALYQQKEVSLQELRALNLAVDQAALFASAASGGEVLYMSNKFRKFLGLEKTTIQGPLAELMTEKEGDQQYIQSLLDHNRSGLWTGEINFTSPKGDNVWLEMSIVPVRRSAVKQDVLILCADITSRKVAQLEVTRLNEDRFAEEFKQQQLRSAQVIEAQEEERKRIARDMHDGIGQMLTALKFNLESINPTNKEKTEQKLAGLKELTTNLIKGVRIATFNLTPPELTDYGIASTLAKLVNELKKLTGRNIIFENQTDFNGRFDNLTETNLYRITQEAVNNAIKYAEANYILVTIKHGEHLLSIVIDDDGRGFDPDREMEHDAATGSGMGLAFMWERVNYINGRLFIRSEPGKGTRITINLPL